MTPLQKIIRSLVFASTGLALVRYYLVINKIWIRRRERVVAESLSVYALLLDFATGLPFLIQYVVVTGDIGSSIRSTAGLFLSFILFLTAIGLWVPVEGKKKGFWSLIRAALKLENREVGDLVKSFLRPKGVDRIVRLLHQLALVDRTFDRREKEFLQTFLDAWHVKYSLESEITSIAEPTDFSRYTRLKKEMTGYLGIHPPSDEVSQLRDVLRAMAHSDKTISSQERTILDELLGITDAYLNKTGGRKFVLFVVPQNQDQEDGVRTLLPESEIRQKGNLRWFTAGTYYSEPFARMACKRYRALGLFSVLEIT